NEEFAVPSILNSAFGIHLSVSRYATKSFNSAPLIEIAGIDTPGLIAGALLIQPARFPRLLTSVPAPRVSRLRTWVRSGPMVVWAATPAMSWHLPHGAPRKTCRPWMAASDAGAGAPDDMLLFQRANSLGGSATIIRAM